METACALVMTALVLVAAPLAADCPVSSPPGGDHATAYGPRQGNFCDGELPEAHGGGELKLIALWSSDHQMATSPPLALEVAGSLLAKGADVHLKGTPLHASLNYRFDARVAAAKLPFTVGTEAALWRLAEELRPDQVGWVAWTQEPGEERIYLPIVAAGGDPRRLEVVVQSVRHAAVVTGNLHEPSGEIHSLVPLRVSVPPGEPIHYSIPGGPEGLVILDLVVKPAGGSSWEAASLRLWRPGS